MKHSILLALCLCWAHLLLSQSALRIDTLGAGGPDVLVLPGSATPGEADRDLGAAFAKTHRVHLVTYPGVGGASPPDYTLHVAPGGRHCPHSDQPTWMLARIREALGGGDNF